MITFPLLCPRQSASARPATNPNPRFPLFPTLLLLLVTQVLTAQTWTGKTNHDWQTASNWLPVAVPSATANVYIPKVLNSPVIAEGIAAVVKSVVIELGAALDIHSNGSLTINGATDQGLFNRGTLTNNGVIRIGTTTGVGLYGLWSIGNFDNNGQINIDRSTSVGLFISAGTFTNSGTITLGATASVGEYGFFNETTFNNSGEITIDRATDTGLRNIAGILKNTGKITIGAATSFSYGLTNNATFENNPGGEIKIDRTSKFGLHNVSGLFTNAGNMTIGEAGNMAGYGLYNAANVKNNPCAKLSIFAPLYNVGGFLNQGLFMVSTNGIHTNNALTNNGIIVYPLNNLLPAVLNNGVIVPALHAGCNGLIDNVLQIGAGNGFVVGSVWYADEALSTPTGNYNKTTNVFSATSPAPALYFNIHNNASGCDQTVGMEVGYDGGNVPVAKCKNATVYLDDDGQLTLSPDQVYGGTPYFCGGLDMSVSKTSFNCSDIQPTPWTVKLTVSSAFSVTTTCQAQVTVKDNLPPTAICKDVTVHLGTNGKVVVNPANLAADSYDNCSVWSYSPTVKTYTSANLGANNLSITVKDWSGNTATCVSVVTVKTYSGLKGGTEDRSEEAAILPENSDLQVYPNPSTGAATVAFQLPTEQHFSVKIFDLSGRVIQSQEAVGVAGENWVSLQLTDVPTGIYLVDLQSTNLNKRTKLSVQH